MVFTIRVKNRGRDLVVHRVETREEAEDLRRVYILLGYPEDRVETQHQYEAA